MVTKNVKNHSGCFRFWSVLLFCIFVLIYTGCEDDDIFIPGLTNSDDSIIINGNRLVYKSDGATLGPRHIEVNTINPAITGSVRLPSEISVLENRDEEASSSSDIIAGIEVTGDCCFAAYLIADKEVFITEYNSTNRAKRVPVVLEFLTFENSDHIYSFQSPPIELPIDYSSVELSLQVIEPNGAINETRLSGTIQLSSDVLIIPIHVHSLLREENVLTTDFLAQDRLFTWFYEPSFISETDHAHGAGGNFWETYTVKHSFETMFSPINSIWKEANIQFNLVSIDYIVDPILERKIINENNLGHLEPTGLHRSTYAHIPGIHVYVGQSTVPNNVRGQANSSCNLNLSQNQNSRFPILALAWKGFGTSLDFAMDESAFAHEIGHILGLQHPDEDEFPGCGPNLAPAATFSNLMHSEGGSGVNSVLTNEQIEFSRQKACENKTALGITNSICE